MRKSTFLILTLISLIVYSSCTKDQVNITDLEGNWRFIGFSAQTEGLKLIQHYDSTISFSTYKSDENGGSIAISGNNLKTFNLTYHVYDALYSKQWINGFLMRSSSDSFSISYPPTSIETTFQQLGTDSVKIAGVNPFSPPGATVQNTDWKYKISGDTLTIDSKVETVADSAVFFHSYSSWVGSIKFLRQ